MSIFAPVGKVNLEKPMRRWRGVKSCDVEVGCWTESGIGATSVTLSRL